MSDAFSTNWYRVATLKPRLRAHAAVYRHIYRGQVWYVLQDNQTGRHFRVSPAANLLLCLMDGRRTTEDIWQAASDRLGAERPTRADTLRLLVQLHGSDLLHAGMPDMAELERRAERDRRSRMLVWLRNPMAMRFPLLDPDRALDRVVPLLRALPWRLIGALWLALVATALVLAALHWPELSANVSDRVLTTQNVLVLVLLYPASKVLHELGHALAIKLGGGEVHEVGVMLLVLVPVPYVEGSGSAAFSSKRDRMGVAAAGVIVELALAAGAVIAWVSLEPGLLRAACFNLALLCSISTLLFNANPLLRFDGYYVLSDLLEIPNLDQRSKRYLLYLLQRYALGDAEAESPVQAIGERRWFVIYGVASLAYRLLVMVGIVLVVASKLFVVGTILAAAAVAQMLVLPVFRAGRYVLTSHRLRDTRRRAVTISAGSIVIAGLLLFALPLPYAAEASGVVWVPDEAVLRAKSDGFIAALVATPGAEVTPGQVLVRMEDPAAEAQLNLYRAELQVAQSRFEETNLLDRVQARLASEALDRARANLAHMEQRRTDLVLTADRAGRFVVPQAWRVPGQFVHQGELIGYVIGPGDRDMHVVVPQYQLDLVRGRTKAVSVRYAEDDREPVAASIVREMPAALDKSPAPGLSSEGGGPIVADPTSAKGEHPLDQFYELTLRPMGYAPAGLIGGHVYGRFDLGTEPVGWRLIRGLRQATLRLLNG